MKIRAIRPGFAANRGVCYTCLKLCEAMQTKDDSCDVYFPISDWSVKYPFVKRVFTPYFKSMYNFKWFADWSDRLLYKKYELEIQKNDIAYIWPETSSHVVKRIKRKKNIFIIVENINCHQSTAKRIIDTAYEYLGWPQEESISENGIIRENEILAIADAVFVANPLSANSLVDNGVSKEKILLSTYGWEPERFCGKPRKISNLSSPVFLSVGLVCVRKGAPLALNAWKKSKIKGTMLFVGRIFPDVQERCSDLLNLPTVRHIEYQTDVNSVYRSADIFLFLTLEEGGPMVTIEAMGCGLPIITTKMGAGEICRDGIEGFIVNPYDENEVIDRMHKLASDVNLRSQMGQAAQKRAMEFTWDKVGGKRLRLLKNHLVK